MMNVLRKTKGVLSVLLLLVLLFTGCNAGGTVTPGSTETTDTVDVDGTTVTTFEGTGDNTTDTVKSAPPSAPETTNEPTKPTTPPEDTTNQDKGADAIEGGLIDSNKANFIYSEEIKTYKTLTDKTGWQDWSGSKTSEAEASLLCIKNGRLILKSGLVQGGANWIMNFSAGHTYRIHYCAWGDMTIGLKVGGNTDRNKYVGGSESAPVTSYVDVEIPAGTADWSTFLMVYKNSTAGEAGVEWYQIVDITNSGNNNNNSGNNNNNNNNTDNNTQLTDKDADGKFSIAIIPDTQNEVVSHAVKYEYFKKRSDWLVANKDKYDLRYVVHTGDVVNWGDADESQLVIASNAMKILDGAGIRSILSLGNHDTAAVGVGGGAADPNNTKARVRDTSAFNKYFSTTRYPYLNVKDSGKVDNSYVTFEAGGAKWLILSLELWPRTEVVDWANTVVKNHSDYNVLVSTHSYMNSDGSISTSNGGYGANSPKYLYDNLIKKYSNIKMVFCGHVGQSKTRVDTGVNGNKIVSVLGCFHANNQNPVRILEIDVNAGTVKGTLHESVGTTDYSNYNFTQSGMNFIK